MKDPRGRPGRRASSIRIWPRPRAEAIRAWIAGQFPGKAVSHTYVAARRLDRAARLLRDTDQPLAAIAGGVGYDSEFALSRAFKRSRGIAPGRYRAGAAR